MIALVACSWFHQNFSLITLTFNCLDCRHESTGAAGRIQCSKDLYEHLAEFPAESQGPLYKFTPRGYVEMKGKNRCYTYWLESATQFNKDASRERISEIKIEVKSLLSKKKWMKRRYFHLTRRASGGIFDETDAISLAPTTVSAAFDHSSSLDDCGTVRSSIPDFAQDFSDECNSSPSDHDTVSYSVLKKTQCKNRKSLTIQVPLQLLTSPRICFLKIRVWYQMGSESFQD